MITHSKLRTILLLIALPFLTDAMHQAEKASVEIINDTGDIITVKFKSHNPGHIPWDMTDTNIYKSIEINAPDKSIYGRLVDKTGSFSIKDFDRDDSIEISIKNPPLTLLIPGYKFFSRVGTQIAHIQLVKEPSLAPVTSVPKLISKIEQSDKPLEELKSLGAEPKVEKTPEYEKTATAAKEVVERQAILGKWQSVLALYNEKNTPTITEKDVYASLGFSEKPQPEAILNPKDFPSIDQSDPDAYQKIFRILLRQLHSDKEPTPQKKAKAEVVTKVINEAREEIREKREKAKEQKQPTQKSG